MLGDLASTWLKGRGSCDDEASRLDREAEPAEVDRFLAATENPLELVASLERVIEQFKEFATTSVGIQIHGAQEALREIAEDAIMGRVFQARPTILRQGWTRFGTPSDPTVERFNAIADIDRLDDLIDRILTAANWDELFGDVRSEPEPDPAQ